MSEASRARGTPPECLADVPLVEVSGADSLLLAKCDSEERVGEGKGKALGICTWMKPSSL
jgi:hypothetical protein